MREAHCDISGLSGHPFSSPRRGDREALWRPHEGALGVQRKNPCANRTRSQAVKTRRQAPRLSLTSRTPIHPRHSPSSCHKGRIARWRTSVLTADGSTAILPQSPPIFESGFGSFQVGPFQLWPCLGLPHFICTTSYLRILTSFTVFSERRKAT